MAYLQTMLFFFVVVFLDGVELFGEFFVSWGRNDGDLVIVLSTFFVDLGWVMGSGTWEGVFGMFLDVEGGVSGFEVCLRGKCTFFVIEVFVVDFADVEYFI